MALCIYVYSVFGFVGMVKQPTNEPSAFTMSSEDFPALPGTAPTSGAGGSSGGEGAQSQQTSNQSQSAENSSSDSRVNNQTGDGSHKKGIITSPDGKLDGVCILSLIMNIVKMVLDFDDDSLISLQGKSQIFQRVW